VTAPGPGRERDPEIAALIGDVAALAADHAAWSAAAWWNAPLPRRWHRCRPHQTGALGDGTPVDRCACGGIRLGGPPHPWLERNSRRRGT
jgi:hypothetical protein